MPAAERRATGRAAVGAPACGVKRAPAGAGDSRARPDGRDRTGTALSRSGLSRSARTWAFDQRDARQDHPPAAAADAGGQGGRDDRKGHRPLIGLKPGKSVGAGLPAIASPRSDIKTEALASQASQLPHMPDRKSTRLN